jgi:putative hydrolase of the HAD superfamily
LVADCLRKHGDFTDEAIDRACNVEARMHHRIWRDEHRTLGAAERLDSILVQFGVTVAEDERCEMARCFEEGLFERPPIPVAGARDIISHFAGRYRLGVISDVGFSPGRVLREMLRRHRLLDAFDSLLFSDEVGRSKPHVELFTRTARTLEASTSDMAHVGDIEFTDIIGAKQAGCYAIRFTGVTPMAEGETTAADRVITKLDELANMIEVLGRPE